MATIIDTTLENLPANVVEIGVSWENEAKADSLIVEMLETELEVFVVREYHYTEEGAYEQWADHYYVVAA